MRANLIAPALLCLGLMSAIAQPADTNEPPPPMIDIPVEIGQDIKDIRFPQYEKDGKLTMRLNAANAERTSDYEFLFKNLHIELFDQSPEKPALEIFLDAAVFNRNSSILSSKTPARIIGENFEINGEQMEFDSKTRSTRLQGPVTMTITQIEEPTSK